jgi:hypothetical protein
VNENDRWLGVRPHGESPSRDWVNGSALPSSRRQTATAARRPWRWLAIVCAGTAACLAVAFWPRAVTDKTPPRGAAIWNVELSSSGTSPVTALVFGEEAGVHLVRIPGADATAEERRRIPARLGAGNVYMVSLGRSGLDVRTTSPPGDSPMSFSAQARFVTLFKSRTATGIRTSW